MKATGVTACLAESNLAAYCQVYGVIHFTSSAGWLPVHRDQLRAQRPVTSMGKLHLLPLYILRPASRRLLVPARRYASAGTSYGPVSVYLSVTSRSSVETAERIELGFFAWMLFLIYPVLCYKEFQISTKIRGVYFPPGLCPKLRTWKISPRHIDRRSVLST